MELVSGPIEIKDNAPREMTAKELLALLKEAKECFWNGYEAACRVQASLNGLIPIAEEDASRANQARWESRFEEIDGKISSEGFEMKCTDDGTFWFLIEKEVKVVEAEGPKKG